MKTVSAFEAKLLRCARAIVARPNLDHARAFANSKLDVPPCLSKSAVELLEDTLAKGITLLLARNGWRAERSLRDGQPRLGRLWERTPPAELGLEFSQNTPALLCWLTAGKSEAPLPSIEDSLTLGDALFRFLAYRLFRGTPMQRLLATALRKIGLCRLYFPEDFPKPDTIDWDRWTTGVGGAIVEAFEGPLAQRWLEIEIGKRQIDSADVMRSVTAGQDAALAGWLDAVERRERWDLARFLVRVASKLLVDGARAENWIGALDVKGTTLAARTNLHRSALVYLTHWQRLADWTGRARAIGYLDEGYAAAQLWKSDWERYRGDDSTRIAQDILREIEPLRQGSA